MIKGDGETLRRDTILRMFGRWGGFLGFPRRPSLATSALCGQWSGQSLGLVTSRGCHRLGFNIHRKLYWVVVRT
jgi:hypothetical protein